MTTRDRYTVFLARRRWLGGFALLVTGLLGACAQAPVPVAALPTPASVTRQEVLRKLGFAEIGDGWELDLSGHVNFEVNDSVLTPTALATLQRIARALTEVGIRHITIEGHTDNQGSEAYNLLLSRRRAESAAQALKAEGFKDSELVLMWYGYARPIADNATETGRQQNRRIALIVASF